MRVTFLLWHGYIGGAERLTADLAAKMSRPGVVTHVVFVRASDLLRPQLVKSDVSFTELRYERGRQALLEPRRLGRAVRSINPDVVITPHVGYLAVALRAGGFRGPVVGVEHGDLLAIEDGPTRRRVAARLTRAACARIYAAEVAVSDYMARRVQLWPHARIATVPNGVSVHPNSAPPPPSAAELVVGYAGRLHPGKGVDQLLRALRMLADEAAPPVRAVIAGDGEMRSAWESLARQLDLDSSVEFRGWVDDVRSHWEECHVVVAPNDFYRESFCMSVAEGMAAGRAAVVTDLGALPELVEEGRSGCVVEASNPYALADAIRRYASDRERVHRHGTAAWLRARDRYSLDQAAERYVGLVRAVLAESRSVSLA